MGLWTTPIKSGRVVALAPRLTSAQGAAFLQRGVTEFPFPVEVVQSDGGAEFLKDFGSKVKELKLIHYFNRPNYPQGNGCIERSLRTDDEEFYQVEELPADVGYKTPEQFYQDWLTTHSGREEVLSDMSCPYTTA